jgi:TRAP transporter TAXI family solute receptor
MTVNTCRGDRIVRVPGAWSRGRTLARAVALSAGLVLGLGAALAAAQELSFFRIGTGSTAGTYFPVGGLIASAVSNPPGSRSCERGGSCGVPGLIAVAQSTSGSVENIETIVRGDIESGFSQADVAYWAMTGTGVFAGQWPADQLRVIANLYPEALHLVVRNDIQVHTIADLEGKRISLDREGSGTRVDALLVLEAYGLGPENVEVVSAAPDVAADMLRDGELDALFMVVGTPAEVIAELAEDSLITLLPIDGAEAEVLRTLYPFFAEDTIEAGTYFNVPFVQTLSVGAQWLTSADMPDDRVYAITQALWHETTRKLLDSGHPKARLIGLETALGGLGVPLHPGAARYYREVGLLQGGQPSSAEAPSSGAEGTNGQATESE